MSQSAVMMSHGDRSLSEVPLVGSASAAVEPPARAEPGGLASRSFLGLVLTQFFGATNDNIFRWLAVYIGMEMVEKRYEGMAFSVGLALFVAPYLLLATPAGYLADRFSKRNVMVGCKIAEILIMLLGIAAILVGSIYAIFAVLFLMGVHSTLFSPSKYGAIPEVVRADRISAANGLIGMTTIIAIVLGTVVGSLLYVYTKPAGQSHWWLSAAVLTGIACLGTMTSLLIRRTPVANPTRAFPVNLAADTYRDLQRLFANRVLLWAALGTALFWSMASLFQGNVALFAKNTLGVSEGLGSGLLAILAMGVAVGNVMAGIWSKGRIELGIVAWGAGGIALGALILAATPAANGILSTGYLMSSFGLFVLGFAAGAYDVPLEAFLQHRSPEKSRGAILSASNFVTFTGTILASGIFGLLSSGLQLSARTIFVLGALAVVPVMIIAFLVLTYDSTRFLLWLVSKAIYRVRVQGLENLPKTGGALLIANHVSFIDGLLLLTHAPRRIRMIVYADYINKPLARFFGRAAQAIPILPGKPRSVIEAIRTAREAIKQGDLVCIFPEGGLTRTGHMQPFHPGFLSILKDPAAPLVPIYLGGLWGSIFSYYGGKLFWKLPQRLRYPVSIRFGTPLQGVTDVHPARQAVAQLGAEDMDQQKHDTRLLPRQLIRTCKRNRFRMKVADTLGMKLTGAELLMRSLILRRLLRRVLAADEKNVGLLLPSSVAGVIANAALAVDRRVAVNLNYTVSSDVMNECIRQAGIRHVLTTRRVLERFPFQIDAQIVYLEDLKDQVRWTDKLAAAVATWLVPAWLLERWYGLHRIDPDDLLTIIFTSGSTGQPKGVMLSHYNIASNIEAFSQVLDLRRSDVLLGVLPFFHSFGYTVTLWSVLTIEPTVVYHYSPLEARPIGQLCRQYGATLLVAAPTFLRSWLRRCEPEDFATVEIVVTGAEKLPAKLADEFQARFKIRPVEGYGTTELSPAVSVNIPPSRSKSPLQKTLREGSVGLPIPGVSVKVVDLDTGADLGPDKSGMLLVSGPNVMRGYLGRPDLTAEVMRDGWYVTGDVAVIDSDGFIHITGRESRFSKIGGEMVPHLRIEEALAKILDQEDEEQVHAVVTSVPDPRKGERLVVLHTGLSATPEQLCRRLADEGLPPLWIPSPDSYRQVESIPVLGTGKLDLKRVSQLVGELFPPEDG